MDKQILLPERANVKESKDAAGKGGCLENGLRPSEKTVGGFQTAS
jgi:hypothetical protein